MREKSLIDEIPFTKEAIDVYEKGIIKELDKIEPTYKRLKLALKKVAERRKSYETKDKL